MNHDIINGSPEDRQLQEVFDETAAKPCEEQLARMLARAAQVPAGQGRGKRRGFPHALHIAVAAAATVILALGGAAWWSQSQDDTPAVASTGAPDATAVPEAVAIADDEEFEELEDGSGFRADPTAELGEDWEGDVWMGELDILHGLGSDDDAFWEEMEQLIEEGG